MTHQSSSMNNRPDLSFRQVERELRKRTFAVLSTVSRTGRAQSSGVLYGVSPPGAPFGIYVISGRNHAKVRNIAANPNVSLIVPLFRRVLCFVPPACIQIHGTAEVLEATDELAQQTFRTSYALRTIPYLDSANHGNACFVRIQPDPLINTYGVGFSARQFRKHWADAGARVHIPQER
jgi:nitroimidazol reductase NimA-like FMN-containing flavoprotein (pyridoxamine 5'-phosphate oxidase superfamily)